MNAAAVALALPRPDWRTLRVGTLAAISLAAGYSLIVGLASQSWSHLIAQWRTDVLFIGLVAVGFGTQMGLYSRVRRIIRGDGRAATGVAAGSTATSTTAMIACCLHHLSDVVPFLGLSGAAAFLIDYKVPVVLLSLAANGIGIVLLLRALRHARAMTPAPTQECH